MIGLPEDRALIRRTFHKLLRHADIPSVASRRRRSSSGPNVSSVRVAVIGAGRVADQHLDVLRVFDDVEVVAICNRGNSDITPLAKSYGIERTFNNWQQMVDTVKPDAVFILVTPFQTVSVAAGCIQRGIPCLIEKPAGFTPAETAYLAAQAEQHRCLNMVAVNRRYYSAINAAIRAIQLRGPLMGVLVEAPERIRDLRVHSRHSQELLDQWLVANSIHAIDLFRHIGGEVTEVCAMSQAWYEPHADSFSATLRFASGALGTFVAHWQATAGWRLSIYGDGVRAILEPLERGELEYADGTVQQLPVDPVDVEFKPGFYAQDRAFIDAVIHNEPLSPPASDLSDTMKTMELIEQIGELHVSA